MEAYWETQDGRRLYRSEVSNHHAMFERRDYKTPIEKKFRQMGGAVLLLANHAHRELHAHVEPPIKPNPDLMRDIYLHARLREYSTPYDLFDQIVHYIGLIAANSRNQQHVEEASLLHNNLTRQAQFIEQGQLTLVRQRVAV